MVLSITTAPRYDRRTPANANQDEVRVHVVACVEQKIVNTNMRVGEWAHLMNFLRSDVGEILVYAQCPSCPLPFRPSEMPFPQNDLHQNALSEMPFQICPSSKCPFDNANSNMPFQKCPFSFCPISICPVSICPLSNCCLSRMQYFHLFQIVRF